MDILTGTNPDFFFYLAYIIASSMEAFLIQYACNYNNYTNYHQYYIMWCVTRSIRAAIEKDGVMQRK